MLSFHAQWIEEAVAVVLNHLYNLEHILHTMYSMSYIKKQASSYTYCMVQETLIFAVCGLMYSQDD